MENETPSLEGMPGLKKHNYSVQKNSGNIVAEKSGLGVTYSDSPIHQGQSTEEDSQVLS